MNYLIDAVAVAGFGWRHDQVPAPPVQRIESFPGYEGQFTVDAPWQPDDLVIFGNLYGEAATLNAAVVALQAVIRTYSQMRQDGSSHTVQIYGDDWTDMKLRDFRSTGDLMPTDRVDTPGNVRVFRPVRFNWIQLYRGVSA